MKRDSYVYEGTPVTIGENISDLIKRVDALLASPESERSTEDAQDAVRVALSIASSLVGPEILQQAFGDSEGLTRVEGLKLLARRQLLLWTVTASLPQDDYDAYSVAREAVSVADGDRPDLFASTLATGAKKVSVRETHYRLHALMWEAYLEALGIGIRERRQAITFAFGEWGAIVKWKRSVPHTLGGVMVEYRLNCARAAGRKGEPVDMMCRGETWQSALTREKAEFFSLRQRSRG